MSRTVFVTGASGFIGGHLVRQLLQRGDQVTALRREHSDLRLSEGWPVRWVTGDLLRPAGYQDALQGCDVAFHCAADYRLFCKDPSPMYRANVDGTRFFLEACRRFDVPRVIYTSSVAALAVPEPGYTSREGDRAHLEQIVGHYKRSKFLAQEVALELAQDGVPVILVNPSTPVGPGDLKPTATGKIVVDFLQKKMPAYLDTGLNLVPVEDVALGHLLAEQRGKVGELYILGSYNMTLKEILNMLSSITGLPSPRIRIPYPVAWTVGALDTLVEGYLLNRQPQIPLEGVKMARKKMFFDSSRARNTLGFRPGSVRAALKRAVDWFVANGYAPAPPTYDSSPEAGEL